MMEIFSTIIGSIFFIILLLLSLKQDETLFGTKGYLSPIRWCEPGFDYNTFVEQRTLSVGTNTAVSGDIMSADGEIKGLIDICAETDVGFAGMLLWPTSPADGYDLDDAIDDAEIVDILRPTGGRTIVACILDSTTTTTADIEEFDWIRVGNTAGHVELFVYAAADSTDTFEIVVGKSYEVMANHTTSDRVFHMWF